MDDGGGGGGDLVRGIGFGGGKSRVVDIPFRMHLLPAMGTWLSGKYIVPRIILGIIVPESPSSLCLLNFSDEESNFEDLRF